MQIKTFLEHHFRHFNAASLVDAARAYGDHVDRGGQMLVTLAGAMSTAELGLSLAETTSTTCGCPTTATCRRRTRRTSRTAASTA
jgi:hypothetical protein